MARIVQLDITVRTTFEVQDGESITDEMIQHRLFMLDSYRVVKTEVRSETVVTR